MKKTFYKFAPLFILIISSINLMCTQNNASTNLTDFKMTIEAKNDSIKLTSSRGCSWKEIQFSLKTNESQTINQYGIGDMEGENIISDKNLADFQFTIRRTEKAWTLNGTKGTKWKNASFGSPDKKTYLQLDQNNFKLDGDGGSLNIGW